MKISFMPREINHRGLFLFGVLFYLIIPLIIIKGDYFDGLPGIDNWKNNAPNSAHVKIYLALVFQMVLFFLFGSFLALKYSSPRPARRQDLGNVSSKFVIIVVTIFVSVLILILRNSAFTGDNGGGAGGGRVQGILSTAGLLVFYLHFATDQPKSSKRFFLILFSFTAVFLLGLGGRMYVIIPLVAYFMRSYNNAAKNGKPLFLYLFIPVLVAISASLIGALRLDEGFDKIGYFIFAEPIFTSWSGFSFVNYDALNWFQIPTNFFVSLFNFVPSLLWAAKGEVLSVWSGTWTKFDAPLGALSIFTSIYGDFGIVLGGVFTFLLGAFFGFLYKASKLTDTDRNRYYCYCAILPFCFFRDPIGIPLKMFITSFGIIPFVLTVIRQSFKKSLPAGATNVS